ncbi:3',5'-cyclic nucleotide phosphodiesterase, putative [Plasmodium sp. gorilla clade G2]|uniref:3',5'-cyclic nucleotide phosphodiesterase, putative n=1 Tax=Plasmodium sp. gorilla clade G2 TaxID=880535 RepID=UPI000D20B3D0|nr:3',5'-cyclic nucleotide phosphodiesterase, putative [Plasmodium sp. gorilla clade G2]SOV17702.1 3',5'-cyclic nucleotide phosphodiesterase, putative [Plasmodium sp. gorilla clade G2]
MGKVDDFEEHNKNSNQDIEKNVGNRRRSNSNTMNEQNENINKSKSIVSKKSFIMNLLRNKEKTKIEQNDDIIEETFKERKSISKDIPLIPENVEKDNKVKKKNSYLKNLNILGKTKSIEFSFPSNILNNARRNIQDNDEESPLTSNSLRTYKEGISEDGRQNQRIIDNNSMNWSTSNINTECNSEFSNIEVKVLKNEKSNSVKLKENIIDIPNDKNKKELQEINIKSTNKDSYKNLYLKVRNSISFNENNKIDDENKNDKNNNIDNYNNFDDINSSNTITIDGLNNDDNIKKTDNINNFDDTNDHNEHHHDDHHDHKIRSSIRSYGNIKSNTTNIKINNDKNFDTNKNQRSIFEKYFYDIWKRNITIKKEIYSISSKSPPNPLKSTFADACLNQSSEKELLKKIPLKFNDDSIESLYVLNLNNWISSRMIIIGIIMLILSFIIWPLTTWSLKTSTWGRETYIVILFHTLMAINTVILVFFIIIGSTELCKYSECMSYVLFSLMVALWGLWNIAIGLTLEYNPNISEMPTTTYELEMIYVLTYIYGFLPLVIIDIFFPSRTKYNWIIHLIFIFLNSTSIILVGSAKPDFVPEIYVVFRILAYTTLSTFLYIGSYTSELQIRYVFYNLLVAGYKLDKIESDMKNKTSNKKISTGIEDLINMLKECTKVILELENETDTNFNVHTKTSYCSNILEQCLSTLTKSDNLYNIDYNVLENPENKKFIEAYVSKSKSNFAGEEVPKGVDFKLNKSFSNNDCISTDKVDLDKKQIKKFLKQINISQLTKMIQFIDNKLLSDWDFNCLTYFEESEYPFFDINLSLICTIDHNIPINIIINFLCFVEKQYNNVPYHNTIHATMVTQKFFCLTKKLGIYDDLEYKIKLVMFISGICHDIGHPGYNNLFFVNSLHPLSIIYNDISVLENYHASITFKILQLNQCNILKNFSEKDFRMMRSYIIELILSTDMKHHFEIISKFRIRRENEDFDYIKNSDDLLILTKMIIKSADISHGSVSWSEHYSWCQRVLSEFYTQGDEELKNKMPLSPLCDRTKHNEVCKSQITFLKFVVMPLFEELSHIDNNKFIKSFCLKRLNSNCIMWDTLMKEEKTIEVYDPASVKSKDKKKKKIDKKKKSYIDLTLFFIKNVSD